MSASISPNLDQITDSGVYPAVLALVGRPYFPTIGLFGWLRAAFLPDGIRVVLRLLHDDNAAEGEHGAVVAGAAERAALQRGEAEGIVRVHNMRLLPDCSP